MEIAQYKKQALTYFHSLSSRERVIIFAGVAVIAVLAVYSVVSSVSGLYTEQSKRIEALQRNFSSVNISLDRYDLLISRLKRLEKDFKKNTPSGGVRSYLENAVISKANAQAGTFSIRPGPTRSLGENYSQAPFSINFSTTDLSNVVSFLQEITQGESSLLLTRLEVIKGRSAEKLTVTADVSSITSNQK